MLSPSLHTLKIEDSPFDKELIEILCQALHDSLNFKNLYLIRCGLNSGCAPPLAKLIQVRNRYREKNNINRIPI